MKEIITVFLGQAGVQLGNAAWELICGEHGINPEGAIITENEEIIEGTGTYFSQSLSEKRVPRSILIDLEPNCIDEVRNGTYSNLFNPKLLISGNEDAANNFARGYFTMGKSVGPHLMDSLRYLVEGSDCMQGFQLIHALSGGTGSGLTSLLMDEMDEYNKYCTMNFSICPSQNLCDSMVEPYNSLLAEHYTMDRTDIAFFFDNQSTYKIVHDSLSTNFVSYTAINRVVSQVFSSLTATIRFHGLLNSDLSSIQTNLVPYPRIHFPLINYAPVTAIKTGNYDDFSVGSITRAIFSPESKLVQNDDGLYMSCCLIYRGNITIPDVLSTITKIKNDDTIKFVDWCPTGIKLSLSRQPPVYPEGSNMAKSPCNVTMVTNNSGIGEVFNRLLSKYTALYSKRAFVHWFVGEGMEEGEFFEAMNNIQCLVKDYEECVKPTVTSDNDDVEVIEETP